MDYILNHKKLNYLKLSVGFIIINYFSTENKNDYKNYYLFLLNIITKLSQFLLIFFLIQNLSKHLVIFYYFLIYLQY